MRAAIGAAVFALLIVALAEFGPARYDVRSTDRAFARMVDGALSCTARDGPDVLASVEVSAHLWTRSVLGTTVLECAEYSMVVRPRVAPPPDEEALRRLVAGQSERSLVIGSGPLWPVEVRFRAEDVLRGSSRRWNPKGLSLLALRAAAAVGFGLATIALVRRFAAETTRQYRAARNRCIECGYDLSGSAHGVCPECGAEGPKSPLPSATATSAGSAAGPGGE